MPALRASRDGYIGVSTPVRAQSSRLTSASALRARCATTWARDQSGRADGAASSSSVSRSTWPATVRSPAVHHSTAVSYCGAVMAPNLGERTFLASLVHLRADPARQAVERGVPLG